MDDLEYADRAVAQMQRCLDAARADVARLVREVQEMAARVDEMRAERDDAAKAFRQASERANRAEAERAVLRADATGYEGNMYQLCDQRNEANARAERAEAALATERADYHRMLGEVRRQVDLARSERDRFKGERDRAEAERDETRAMYLAAVGLADSLSERLRRAEAERDAAKAARALPGGRDPGVKAYDAGPCASCRNPIEGHDYYRDRDPGDAGGENYHRDCWAWVKSNGTGPRPRSVKKEYKPSPAIALTAAEVHEALGWNVPAPAAKLPVVPACCSDCASWSNTVCVHRGAPKGWGAAVVADGNGSVPTWCPIRAELAKVTP